MQHLIHTFDGLSWLRNGGALTAWLGQENNECDYPVSSVCGFMFTPSDEILLVRHTRRGWDLPGGHVDDGETPEEAFVREMGEETGLEITADDFTTFGSFRIENEKSSMRVVIGRVDIVPDVFAPTAPPDEICGVAAFPTTNLPLGNPPTEPVWSVFLPYLPYATRVEGG